MDLKIIDHRLGVLPERRARKAARLHDSTRSDRQPEAAYRFYPLRFHNGIKLI